MAFQTQLWRALGVYRVLALGYASVLYVRDAGVYAYPGVGWLVLTGMGIWTVATLLAYRVPAGRRWPVLAADMAVGVGTVLITRLLDTPVRIEAGASTLPTIWSAAPVLAWAISGGWRSGTVAAVLIGGANVAERGTLTPGNTRNIVMLTLAGVSVGYVTELARHSELALARALRARATAQERERLARGIHDSVLQVLALVRRRGVELGGAAAELGRLAGEQEAALRALLAISPDQDLDGPRDARVDLRSLLRALANPRVTISAPDAPVLLDHVVAQEVAAAVVTALDNVRRHAGKHAHAWLLVEEESDEVVVSVRDDGPGIPDGRLTAAVAQGRLGMAQSIQGRLRDLGGSATVTCTPGQGAEIELRLPRQECP